MPLGLGFSGLSSSSHVSGLSSLLTAFASSDPASWGPSMWRSLHCIAHHLPPRLSDESRQSFQAMVETLPQLLPCKVCGQHLKEYFRDDPVTSHLDTRDHVEQWLVQLHNKVNLGTGKPALSQAQAVQAITGQCGESPTAADLRQETLAAAAETPISLGAISQASGSWFLALAPPPRGSERTAPHSKAATSRHAEFFPSVAL